MMLKELNIKGYRRFQDITFRNFNRINVITGGNNTGKTTLLKAVFAWSCGLNIGPVLLNAIVQPLDFEANSQKWLFEAITSAFKNKEALPLTIRFAGLTEDPTDCRVFLHTLTAAERSAASSSNQICNQPSSDVPVCRWCCRDDLGNEQRAEITATPAFDDVKPHYEAQFIDANSTAQSKLWDSIFNHLKSDDLLEEFTENIQREYAFIQGFDIVKDEQSAGPVCTYLNDGSKSPLYALGNGVQRFFTLLGTVMTGHNQILCIEEPELSLTRSAQKELCADIIKYAHQNQIQIFIATHSQEFIDSMISAACKHEKDCSRFSETGLQDLSFYTLGEYKSRFRYRYLSGKEAFNARADLYLDLRGES